MKDDLLGCLARLRRIQDEMKEKALCDAFDHRVRAAYFDAETTLSRGLGELDQIANLNPRRNGCAPGLRKAVQMYRKNLAP